MNLFSKAYELVKFEAPAANEDRMRTYLRINVLQWACNYGHADCKKAAVDEFNRYYENPSVKVHPDLRQVVYCEGIRQGTDKHFEFLWKQYLTTNMATEQILILQGIGCAQDRELVFVSNFLDCSGLLLINFFSSRPSWTRSPRTTSALRTRALRSPTC